MEIRDLSEPLEVLELQRGFIDRLDGELREESVSVPVEHQLSIFLNGNLIMKVTCSPSDLIELVVGRLYTSGMIEGIDEIESIELSQDSRTACVVLGAQNLVLEQERVSYVPTTGTGNRQVSRRAQAPVRTQVEPIPWERDWVYDLARELAQDTPTHRATNGVHSCFLSVAGERRYCCEDLGRHNAMDKVIGAALLDGVDLRQALVLSSGRLPVDMMEKVIFAGIPIVATKAIPTQLAIDLAKEARVTLVCQARPDSLTIFNNPVLAPL